MTALVGILRHGEDQGVDAVCSMLVEIGLLQWDPPSQTYVVLMERGTKISGYVFRAGVEKRLGRR